MKVCIRHKHCVRRGETYQIVKQEICDVCYSLDCIVRDLINYLEKKYNKGKTNLIKICYANVAVEIGCIFCEKCHFIGCKYNPIRDDNKTWFGNKIFATTHS